MFCSKLPVEDEMIELASAGSQAVFTSHKFSCAVDSLYIIL